MITRNKLTFETRKQTTEIPNAWHRDKRLSRRARGLLGELMSHSEGWRTSLGQLLQNGPEGRDALNSAIKELEQHGYLTRVRGRSAKGTFEVDYELSDPLIAPVDNSADGPISTSAENPSRSGFTTAGNPRYKKTHLKEDLNQSSNQPHLEGVDNFPDDDQLNPVINFPTPAKAASYHPTEIDRERLRVSLGAHFVDAGISDEQLHSFALQVLGRATTHVTDPTAYAIHAIRNDLPEWQKRAYELAGRTNQGGGNPF